ncbi:MAG: hypothetical protein FRX49_01776 [Trebouxia sp. A1-2]|nr:MAG: hypothetical protein FRX49_01776 [Trebouxia sp. A1-2]
MANVLGQLWVGASTERLAGEEAYEFCMSTSTAWHLEIGPKALNDRAGLQAKARPSVDCLGGEEVAACRVVVTSVVAGVGALADTDNINDDENYKPFGKSIP